MLTWGFPAMRVQVGVPVIQGMEVGLRKLEFSGYPTVKSA